MYHIRIRGAIFIKFDRAPNIEFRLLTSCFYESGTTQ
jgi:hypothetical protein